MSDPAKYRERGEVEEMRKSRDPIDHAGRHLVERGLADAGKLKEIDKEVRAVVAEAARFAQENPEPDIAELYTDVWLQGAK